MDTDEWAISQRYCDAENCWHETSGETQQRILQAMRVVPGDRPPAADPVRVIRSGEAAGRWGRRASITAR